MCVYVVGGKEGVKKTIAVCVCSGQRTLFLYCSNAVGENRRYLKKV